MTLKVDCPLLKQAPRSFKTRGYGKAGKDRNDRNRGAGQDFLQMFRANDQNPRLAEFYDAQRAPALYRLIRIEAISLCHIIGLLNAQDDLGDRDCAIRMLHVAWLEYEFRCLMLRDLQQCLWVAAMREGQASRAHHPGAVRSIHQTLKCADIRGVET